MTAPAADLAGPLTAWLAERLQGDEVVITALERPAAGQSNDTVLCEIRAGGREEHLVVRRQATETPIFHKPDVLREARVLQGLASTAVPVPAVRWVEPDPSVLGAPFFVMERIAGRVPLGKPSIHTEGWLPTLNRPDLERLWTSAMEVMVAVHAVGWERTHRFLLDGAASEPSVVQRVAELRAWYEWSTSGRTFPITDTAIDHLTSQASRVDAGEPVLLWGDPRVGNMLFGDDDAVTAALDWETASVGPASQDLAHWLFFDDFQTRAAGIEPLPGWPDRDTTIARYSSFSGRSIGDLEFFDLVEELFMATTLIRQADARVARGLAPPDTRMGHDNTVTQMIARRLGLPVPDLSPDYLAHRGVPVARRTA